MFGIWCEVSGGVTGYRCAWMKSSGAIARFETREQAEAEAARLMQKTNGDPYRKADFSYRAREF